MSKYVWMESVGFVFVRHETDVLANIRQWWRFLYVLRRLVFLVPCLILKLLSRCHELSLHNDLTCSGQKPVTERGLSEPLELSNVSLNRSGTSEFHQGTCINLKGHKSSLLFHDLWSISNDKTKSVYTIGCFLKWWYPQNTPKWSFLVGKPIGYHHLRKPPIDFWYASSFLWGFWDSFPPAAASTRRYSSVVLCPVGNKPIPPVEGEADANTADELTDETVPGLQKSGGMCVSKSMGLVCGGGTMILG